MLDPEWGGARPASWSCRLSLQLFRDAPGGSLPYAEGGAASAGRGGFCGDLLRSRDDESGERRGEGRRSPLCRAAIAGRLIGNEGDVPEDEK